MEYTVNRMQRGPKTNYRWPVHEIFYQWKRKTINPLVGFSIASFEVLGTLSKTRRIMNSRRDYRSSRAALFDGIEEGGIRASSYSSNEIDEHDNDRAVDGLQDRVNILKRLTGDVHEEVESHNRMLDRMVPSLNNLSIFFPISSYFNIVFSIFCVTVSPVQFQGNDMDSSRGVLSGTMDRFKMVFENKSSRRMVTLVASFVVLFLLVYYLTNCGLNTYRVIFIMDVFEIFTIVLRYSRDDRSTSAFFNIGHRKGDIFYVQIYIYIYIYIYGQFDLK
ncbi:hypothetical protein IEQ34_004379 [Dendrobium chrysotoxum]|uniref:t-SNARE coiled-coil homology domain-containing protein n=1 Tax=Dendrobium chrysotoxum TaxID=161865 RepID=A0AAV7HDV8_DENCH|nr:hypothetical protein IEQ34_004379 [Dendrobium chrysotoxum]